MPNSEDSTSGNAGLALHDGRTLSSLIRSRGHAKGQLTRVSNFLSTMSDETSVLDLEMRLKALETAFERFTLLDEQVYELVETGSQMEEVEEQYFNSKGKILQFIKQRSMQERSSANETVPSTNVNISWNKEFNLPKLELPCFSGDYQDWPTFQDLFEAAVHNNARLQDGQRFQYLKAHLKGDAQSIIKHSKITDANYAETWERLKKRYNRKNHIAASLVKTFLDQPSVNTGSAKTLRKLADTSEEIIRGLKAIGAEAETRDLWLIHLLLNKLDPESRQQWAEESSGTDFPTFKKFLDFLTKRCDALEAYPSAKKASSSASVRAMHATTKQEDAVCPKCSSKHSIYECGNFKSLSLAARRDFIREATLCFNCLQPNHAAKSCPSTSRCRKCRRPHHTLVHDDNYLSNSGEAGSSQPSASGAQAATTERVRSMHTTSTIKPALLATARVLAKDKSGKHFSLRAFLDGGSEVSLITEECVKRLGLPRKKATVTVGGLIELGPSTSRGLVSITLSAHFDPTIQISLRALILANLTTDLPAEEIDISGWDHLRGLQLADPEFYIPAKVDIIIGAESFLPLFKSGHLQANPSLPVARDTSLGWIVSGPLDITASKSVRSLGIICDIDESLRRFWEYEEMPFQTKKSPVPFTPDEEACENLFLTTHSREVDGRFVVALPFNTSVKNLGDTLTAAERRLSSMERRFKRDPLLGELYARFMAEYLEMGHMELIPEKEIRKPANEVAYLPHHAVRRPNDLSKLRVVFDGSTKSSTGVTLNDCLLVGPTLQRDLFAILIKFRSYRIAFSADVKKMFRQVKVRPADRDFQRILWRADPQKPVEHYQLCTVTYGTSAAPYLSTRSLIQAAREFRDSLPTAAHAIETQCYMDDILCGADSPEEAVQLAKEISKILSACKMPLDKWKSNSVEVIREFAESSTDSSRELSFDNMTQAQSVLGIQWNPVTDEFGFSVPTYEDDPVTKRTILSEASRIFDPLGWLSPVTLQSKLLYQDLWLLGVDWDQELPDEVAGRWRKIRSQLTAVNSFRIPRWMGFCEASEVQLHGFSDASERAYAAVVYGRVQSGADAVFVHLLTAKTRVASLKQTSIARLELCGAYLLCQLIEKILEAVQLDKLTVHAWTDSQVVLAWLSDVPRRWNSFVSNRTAYILEHIPRSQWGYVSTKCNPADCASRGLPPGKLKEQQIWWNGPDWLARSRDEWPVTDSTRMMSNPPETRRNYVLNMHVQVNKEGAENVFQALSNKLSHWSRFVRVIAYVRRFAAIARKQRQDDASHVLTASELAAASAAILKWVQQEAYGNEIRELQKSGQVCASSSLKCLLPFLDNVGLIRVGGRLNNSNCPFPVKHPIILPPDHKVTLLIVSELHRKYLHAGVTTLLHLSRQTYWILRGRNLIKKVVRLCQQCFAVNPRTQQQLMAALPASRVTRAGVFERVGVDYAGPIRMYPLRKRGAVPGKGYVAVFVCMVTKAIHLERVGDLSTDAFLGAFRRFAGRRGLPTEVYSDNGSNFVGAKNYLSEVANLFASRNFNHVITEKLAQSGIKWSLIPPNAPHFGGLWESSVKLMKTHLRRVVGDTILTFEEMDTLLVQIEAVLNSRPLCTIYSDEDRLDILTPGHFLIGRVLAAPPDDTYEDTQITATNRWKMIQAIHQSFWRSWQRDYITSLHPRAKWRGSEPPVKKGDVVLVSELNQPPTTWARGLVVETHPGKDGLVRVVSVRMASGHILKRPITRICVLPVESK